jgi:hypothetical protein
LYVFQAAFSAKFNTNLCYTMQSVLSRIPNWFYEYTDSAFYRISIKDNVFVFEILLELHVCVNNFRGIQKRTDQSTHCHSYLSALNEGTAENFICSILHFDKWTCFLPAKSCSSLKCREFSVRSEDSTAVTMKNVVFWDMTPGGCSKKN